MLFQSLRKAARRGTASAKGAGARRRRGGGPSPSAGGLQPLEGRTLLAGVTAAAGNAPFVGPQPRDSTAAALRAIEQAPAVSLRASAVAGATSASAAAAESSVTTLVEDSLTEASSKLLTAHVPETGGAYAVHPTTTGDAVVMGGTGRARHSSTGNTFVTNAANPSSADYDVEGEIEVFGTLGTSGGAGENTWGVAARWDPAAATGYVYRYNSAARSWQLFRYRNGAATALGPAYSDPLSAGSVRVARINVSGATVRGYVDGVLRATVTDSAPVTAAGRGGMRMYDGTNVPATDSRGIHVRRFGVTRPAAAAPPGGTTVWVASGGVSKSIARVKARVTGDGNVRLKYTTRADLSGGMFTTARRPTLAGGSWIADFPLNGLLHGRTYYYAVELNGVLDTTRVGRFRTFAGGAQSFKFAFGADFNTGSTHPVWDTIRSHDPAFVALIGDNGYVDEGGNVPASFRDNREANHASTEISDVYQGSQVVEIWDDHDFGLDNSDGTSASEPAAHKVYREYVPSYQLAGGTGPTDGIYQSWTVGRVRFLMTDNRTYKAGAGTSSGTILGERQKLWFKKQLKLAKDDPNVAAVMWLNSLAWNSNFSPDSWAAHPNERRELATYMDQIGIAPKLFILCGDTHAVALDDGTNSQYAADGTGPITPLLIGAALDRPGSGTNGAYSHGSFAGTGQFGLVTVNDKGGGTVEITLSGRTYTNAELTSWTTAVPVTPVTMTVSS